MSDTHSLMNDTDGYDGWGDDDGDPRDYSREGQRVSITTARFPAGMAAAIEYQIADTNCYCLTVDNPGPAANTDTVAWYLRAYALRSEITF